MSVGDVSMPSDPVPDIVINRLPIYLRMLDYLLKEKKQITSSQELSERLGLSSPQIRKDLSYFGEFGKQGTGYDIVYLKKQLSQILKIDRTWEMLIIGAGDLGRALANYKGFEAQGFHLVAIFDIARKKVGTQVGLLQVQDMAELPRIMRERKLQIAILAVPVESAQQVAEQLVDLGIRAILNYAPITLNMPLTVRVLYIDPVAALQSMAYYL